MAKKGENRFPHAVQNISRKPASLISEEVEPLLYSDDGSRTNPGVCGTGVTLAFRESKIESPTSAKRCSFYSVASMRTM